MALSDTRTLRATRYSGAECIGGQPRNEDLLLLFPLWPTLFEERSITRLDRPAASVALQGVATAARRL